MLAIVGVIIAQLTYIGSLTQQLHAPARLGLAPDNTVLVTEPAQNRIVRFNRADLSFVEAYSVANGPVGIAVAPTNDRYYVSLQDIGKVAVLDANFAFVSYLGEGNPFVSFVRPTDLCVDGRNGNVYVVDGEGDRVYGFTSSGALALRLGIRGGGGSQFRYPSAITIDEGRNRLIVADHDNFRVQVFTMSGVFLFAFGDRNKYPVNGPSEGWVPRTQGLAVDPSGRILVSDAMMSTVRRFDTSGNELSKLLHYGFNPGDLRTPCDLALTPDGLRLFVVSTNASAVEVYGVSGFRGGGGGPKNDRTLTAAGAGLAAAADLVGFPPGGGEGGSDGDEWPGGGPLPRTNYTGPHIIESPIICGRCHAIRLQPGESEFVPDGQFVLCTSCHTAGGQAILKTIQTRELADPFATNPAAVDHSGSSHAWGVPAVNASADSVGPASGSEMAAYLTNGQMKCTTCHNTHNSDTSAPYLRVSNRHDAMCKECHAPRNEGPGQRGTHPVGFAYPAGQGEFPAAAAVAPMQINEGNVECTTCHAVHKATSGEANNGDGDGMLLRTTKDDSLCRLCHTDHTGHTPSGAWQPGCLDCHEPHDPASNNLSLVARTVRNQTLSIDKTVVFTSRSGANSFDDGDPAVYDGICQVCHTGTSYHRHDGSGASHHDGETCTQCHPHNAGFMPAAGSCTDCHASPQDNGDGVPAGGRRAVVGEFPVGSAHAHYGASLDGAACTVCHSQTTHMDGYVDLVDPDDGSIYRFVRGGDLTQDPDLSDFCQHCHDADGAQRLPNPADPFGNGNVPPNTADKFNGTLQWHQFYTDYCFGDDGTLRGVNSHHDISDADQTFSGAKVECLNCHGAHSASAESPNINPAQPTTPWNGSSNDFCLSCHNGGAGPADPGFPPGVTGPTIALRGIESCAYVGSPFWVDYTWTNSAHGLNSKRAWPVYSGAPAYELNCVDCHDPHGSYTPTNTAGNPYMIRDFVDGTQFVDDGYLYARPWIGPPWNTYGVAREVVVSINNNVVGWGTPQGLCGVCHPYWQANYTLDWWHDSCTSCESCHSHGSSWGEYDWPGSGAHDTPCPPAPNPIQDPRGNMHDRNRLPSLLENIGRGAPKD
ncbi:MAG: hypothetical protein HZB38_10290 [Planctomycetes bacterium]|nr:hypothetical protein [Planctomycetota bacterium]